MSQKANNRPIPPVLPDTPTVYCDWPIQVGLYVYIYNIAISGDQPVNIVRENAAKLEWTRLLNNSDCDFTKATQHSLQDLDLVTVAEIKAQSSLRDQARLNTLSSTHSGSWLWAVPNLKLGLTMLREEFLIACRVWLGLPVFCGPPNHLRCPCSQTLDVFGEHILGCRKGHLCSKLML